MEGDFRRRREGLPGTDPGHVLGRHAPGMRVRAVGDGARPRERFASDYIVTMKKSPAEAGRSRTMWETITIASVALACCGPRQDLTTRFCFHAGPRS